MKKYLLTSALPYANGYLHLGHIAGAYLPADMVARFLRLSGERVLYVCGSDEHGVAITIAAEKKGVSPQEIIDHYHSANHEAFQAFSWSFDTYGRTSDARHREVSQDWFLDFYNKGILREKEEDQFFDEQTQMFLPDRYVEGTCPNCGSDRARGDQCDNCGAYYNQLELKNPRSLVSGKTPVVKKATHWYYPLGDFQERLEHYIESHNEDWKDNVLQQSRSWLKQGLGDRAITRDLNWGVPVPLEQAKGKVLYVWFDAVLGYISATQVWAAAQGQPEAWKEWWLSDTATGSGAANSDSTEYIAFIGKDNIVFHTLMFPSMLMARGGYVVPSNVPANEFLNLQGQKFSKSRNWSVDLRDAMHKLPLATQRDALRYTLAMNFPETRDSDFSWQDYQVRTNNELAAILGNFVNRSVQFMKANFESTVPLLPERYAKLNEAWDLLLADFRRDTSLGMSEALERYGANHVRYFNEQDLSFLAALHYGALTVASHYRSYRLRDALSESMNIARAANKYFNDSEPWKSVKTDRDACAKTLYICSQSLRSLAFVFAPIMPNVSHMIQQLLGLQQSYAGEALNGRASENYWSTIAEARVSGGQPLGEAHILFAKVEDEFIAALQATLGVPEGGGAVTTQSGTSSGGASSATEAKAAMGSSLSADNLIGIDDFKKVQLRTATILEAERVPKSDKLIKLQVDTGADRRQILAGIGKFYEPEQLIGKTVVVVVNLKPAKLMGHESQGMLLAANSESGLSLISPIDRSPNGAEVR